MKNVIVIIDAKNSADYDNVLREATQGQPIRQGVTTIIDKAWMIDLHKAIGFFSGLVHGANIRKVDVFVFAVEEILHFADRPNPEFTKVNLEGLR